MGKQVGPTPITAKLKRTTKVGIVQPQLKTLQSPAKKETRLTGRQIQERNAKRIAERKAARQQTKSTSPQLKPGQTGYYRQEKRKGRNPGDIRKENYAAARGTSTGSKDPNYGISPSSNMPVSQPVPDLLKGPSNPPKKSTATPKAKKTNTTPQPEKSTTPETTKKVDTTKKS